jgi:ASCH domain
LRGLKIQEIWIDKIFSGEKTMEVRSMHYKISGQRIALGNSRSGLVEGYCTIQEIMKIPFSKIARYEDKHRAAKWLKKRYIGKDFLYGFILNNVKKEKKPFPSRSPGICFIV